MGTYLLPYHWPHALCIIAGGPQNQLIYPKILPFSIRKCTSYDLLSKYLLIMELRFGAIWYSNLSNENYDADHINCSR